MKIPQNSSFISALQKKIFFSSCCTTTLKTIFNIMNFLLLSGSTRYDTFFGGNLEDCFERAPIFFQNVFQGWYIIQQLGFIVPNSSMTRSMNPKYFANNVVSTMALLFDYWSRVMTEVDILCYAKAAKCTSTIHIYT